MSYTSQNFRLFHVSNLFVQNFRIFTRTSGWFPAVYMSYMCQNLRLLHVLNLSVRNFRIFLLMYTESVTVNTNSVRPLAVHHVPGAELKLEGAH